MIEYRVFVDEHHWLPPARLLVHVNNIWKHNVPRLILNSGRDGNEVFFQGLPLAGAVITAWWPITLCAIDLWNGKGRLL